MKNCLRVNTDWGQFILVEEDGSLTRLCLPGEALREDAAREETPLLREGERQLRAYLAGELKTFDLPLAPKGTEFQRAVWAALTAIAYGQTRSYADIARAIGRPKAFRAVGMANHNNPIGIVIPCHRVVGSDGSLTGYGGGLELKERLLAHESAQ